MRWGFQRGDSSASTVISKRQRRAEDGCYANCGGRGGSRIYMPLQCGRSPESSLNGGPASGEGQVRDLLEYTHPRIGGRLDGK